MVVGQRGDKQWYMYIGACSVRTWTCMCRNPLSTGSWEAMAVAQWEVRLTHF